MCPPIQDVIRLSLMQKSLISQPAQNLKPYFTRESAWKQKMIDSFRGLVTEHANVIVLQPPSFPTSGGPAPVMDDEPNEEFALCRSSRPAERAWFLTSPCRLCTCVLYMQREAGSCMRDASRQLRFLIARLETGLSASFDKMQSN